MKIVLTVCLALILSHSTHAASSLSPDTYACSDADGFVIGYLFIDITGSSNLELAGDWTGRDPVTLSATSSLGDGCFQVTIQGMDGANVINQPGAKCCTLN